MSVRRLLTAAVVLGAVLLVAAPEAEARGGWRRARWSSPRATTTYQPRTSLYSRSGGPVVYSGVSRAEQSFWNRRDAWNEAAYNGWSPADFR